MVQDQTGVLYQFMYQRELPIRDAYRRCQADEPERLLGGVADQSFDDTVELGECAECRKCCPVSGMLPSPRAYFVQTDFLIGRHDSPGLYRLGFESVKAVGKPPRIDHSWQPADKSSTHG